MLGQNEVRAQIKNQPYSYQLSQKMNDVLYSPQTRLHTSSKPFLFKDELLVKFDSIQSNQPVASDNWFMRKLFNEHLIEVSKEDYTFYADFLPDLTIGKDMMGDKRRTWMNSRGFQAGVTLGEKFTFYTSATENQAVFPQYLSDYIDEKRVVTGQGTTKFGSGNEKDWMNATASLTYDFSKYFQATVAYDKNFIGDGYRSLLLSDFSSNYTHLKFTGTIGHVQYTSVWAYMNDPTNKRSDQFGATDRYGDGKKWGVFQYIDYNATNRFSIGFFQAITWANQDAAGKRGFDFTYINPVMFLRPVESNNSSSPDKMFLGLNSKYKVLKNVTAYGQFLLGEFTAKEFFAGKGYVHNKWGAQFGVRGFDIFDVKNLNFLVEYNTARPYTYAHFDSGSNYSNNAEPLAHPLGANFREIVGIANYAWKRFDFSAQLNYNQKGLDPEDGTNMGGDIFQSYRTFPNRYDNHIGQGIKSQVVYADAKAAYVLNPKYNLRFEIGYSQRYQKIEYDTPLTHKSGVFSIGLRSSLRSLYSDF
ncbi:gliding motility protein RemB [Sphingobacterium faecium]|nr:gliding motility protein RemB [Sphingobacterium faecium]